MKLGIFTAAFPGKSLEEVAAWAAENDFETLELACWPVEKATRRYAGVSTIDVSDLNSGLYLMQLRTDKEIICKKILIK